MLEPSRRAQWGADLSRRFCPYRTSVHEPRAEVQSLLHRTSYPIWGWHLRSSSVHISPMAAIGIVPIGVGSACTTISSVVRSIDRLNPAPPVSWSIPAFGTACLVSHESKDIQQLPEHTQEWLPGVSGWRSQRGGCLGLKHVDLLLLLSSPVGCMADKGSQPEAWKLHLPPLHVVHEGHQSHRCHPQSHSHDCCLWDVVLLADSSPLKPRSLYLRKWWLLPSRQFRRTFPLFLNWNHGRMLCEQRAIPFLPNPVSKVDGWWSELHELRRY